MSTTNNAGLTPKFTIIPSNVPETLMSALYIKRRASFLVFRRPVSARSRSSGYIIETVHGKRGRLLCRLATCGVEITEDKWYYHGGLYWPDDLAALPGPWKDPLTFSFPRLMLLDLDVRDAVYWLMPILQAMDPHTPFRRVILRGCVDYDEHAVSFPFGAFDSYLDHWPAAKVLIGWAGSEEDYFIQVWRTCLPKLEAAGRIGVLYSYGPHGMLNVPLSGRMHLIFVRAAILPPIGEDHENLGPVFVDETGMLYHNLYAPGCINEWSWSYRPDQDPFGSIYDHI